MQPYQLTKEEAFSQLETSPRGLTEVEASARLEKYGRNKIEEVRRTPLIFKFLANLYNLFAILLWVGAVLSFITGVPELGYAIIAVIILNAIFAFIQEYKAEKAIEALKQLLPSYAKVLREGDIRQILAEGIVPGDILVLEEGDNISADGRLTDAFEMRTINAALTGESAPVRKTTDPLPTDNIHITEAPNLVFAGTSVASGSGRAVVYATSGETQFGQIARLTQAIREELSPLQREVVKATQVVATLAVVFGTILFIVALFITELGTTASLLFAIGIIIANVPEGLLPTLSLSLAAGVQRMARKHALIKKLSSVEALGSTTVIATDKTGTLTQNEMTVREVWVDNRVLEVTGVGYEPVGTFIDNGRELTADELRQYYNLWRSASFCTTSRLVPPGDGRRSWSIVGDPTEASLLVAASKAGFDITEEFKKNPRVYLIPFESARKRMTSINQVGPVDVACVKGAPKETLDLSTKIKLNGEIVELTPEKCADIIRANDAFARRGLRVLAIAEREVSPEIGFTAENVERNLIFLGLMAMQDPPRPEVEHSVIVAKRAGIRTIMITGDYGLTAESIARKIRIVESDNPRIITGVELNAMSDKQLKDALYGGEVIFARVAPEHKMRIVSVLKDRGEIVAVTGDGVNDAPALKRADIGVAMGIAGTDVAKEASEMVLTDDNFASIVAAVEEGRTVFDNIKKFITYIFAHLTPEIVPFVLFVVSGGAIPLGITVLLILAIDLGTETLSALALGIEPAEPGVMERLPRKRGEGIIDRHVLFRGYVFFGLIETVLVSGAFFTILYSGGWTLGTPDISDPASPLHGLYLTAVTMTFLGIVGTQVGTVFATRTSRASVFEVGLFSNRWVILGIIFSLLVAAAVIYIPFMQNIFGTAPLGVFEWVAALLFGIVILVADELRKSYLRRKLPPSERAYFGREPETPAEVKAVKKREVA
ncbi:MAG: cation-transporting P-type ATPase [Actinobacteria bacterium]|nr:cation-transporting P-type ATPase [Actinomycetota bacterium]